MSDSRQNTRFIKDCIAQALLKLMQEKEYEEISVSELCRKAGVGRTTFYRHFTNTGNKDDVLFYYAVSLWAAYCDERREQAQQDAWGTLMNFIYDNRCFFTHIGKASLDHILFSIFYKTMGPTEKDTPETAYFKSFLAGAVFGITYNWIETGFPKSPAALAEEFSQMQKSR